MMKVCPLICVTLLVLLDIVSSENLDDKHDTITSENNPYIRPSNRVQGNEGDSITVTCHAKNLRQLPKKIYWTIQKYFKSNPYNDLNQKFTQHQDSVNTTTLYIGKLHRSDAGVYHCVLVFYDNTVKVSNLFLHVVGRNFSSSCGHTRFRCQTTEDCIFLRYRCDGLRHCPDGSDEVNCGAFMCQNKFRCKNGRCIDQMFVCDGSDNCDDYSDEIRCAGGKMEPKESLGREGVTSVSTSIPTVSDVADHFNWLKTTVYIVIGCTVALVIFISFIVVVVFRVKMKRLRARRVARALERHRRHQSGSQHGRQAEHEAFLPVGSNSHFGNIIVNVNNGVQYVPNSEFSGFVESPPSYSEVVGIDSEYRDSPPPAYSTIDRNPKTTAETATNTSRQDLSSQIVMQTPSTSSPPPSVDTRAQTQNIFTSVEGAMGPSHYSVALPVNSSSNNNNNSASTSTNVNNLVLSEPSVSYSHSSASGKASSGVASSNQSSGPSTSRGKVPKRQITLPRLVIKPSSAPSNELTSSSNIFMAVEGATSPLTRPLTNIRTITPVPEAPTAEAASVSRPVTNVRTITPVSDTSPLPSSAGATSPLIRPVTNIRTITSVPDTASTTTSSSSSRMEIIDQTSDEHPVNLPKAHPSSSRTSAPSAKGSNPSANIFMSVEGATASLSRSRNGRFRLTDDSLTTTPDSCELSSSENQNPCRKKAVSPNALLSVEEGATALPLIKTLDKHEDSGVSPETSSSSKTSLQNADNVAGGGNLTVHGGKLYLRSDSSSSTAGVSTSSQPIKGHLEVKGGQIIIKQDRRGQGPVDQVPAVENDANSICSGDLSVQEGRIVLH